MRKDFISFGAAACASALFASTMAGCSGGSVCDVDFASIAGTYSFTMTTGSSRYTNSCFDTFDTPEPDPAMMKNCTWTEEPRKDTVTVEIVVTEDGNLGDAKVTKVTYSDGQSEDPKIGVKCEMLEGEICNAPIRCTLTGQTCDAPTPTTDDWKFSCNCLDGGTNDPTSQVCLDCKAAYEKYQAETQQYCQKETDSAYFEFMLNVK